MTKTVEFRWHERVIRYDVRRSRRARHVRITIHPEGRIVVTTPWRAPQFLVERFVAQKGEWITRTVDRLASKPLPLLRTGGRNEYLEQKKEALRLATERVEHFNRSYGFLYQRISIRNQSSRWGSCSRNGNLSFNYRLVFLAPELRDYLIIHELCHLQAFDHSKRFWELVEKAAPSYRLLRKRLRSGLG